MQAIKVENPKISNTSFFRQVTEVYDGCFTNDGLFAVVELC